MYNSKSSDKLEILLSNLNKLPPEAFQNLLSITLHWEPIDELVVPLLNIVYKK